MVAERLLVLTLVAAALAVVWLGLRWRSARYRRPDAGDVLAQLAVRRPPLVLAFTTPECVPCRTMQRPALEELQRRYPGRFELREVDATVAPELAERFGLMTVPSTVVIDVRGRVRAINHGLARWPKLAGQLNLNGKA
ncbi:MAG TPA: thioredoxin family protein [bacterium]